MTTIRIPRPVNRALDAMARHPRSCDVALAVGLVGVLAVAVWWSPTAAMIGTGVLLAYMAVVGHRLAVRRLREELRQRDYDLAAKDAEIERLREGDPSAPTMRLRSIGEGGEPT